MPAMIISFGFKYNSEIIVPFVTPETAGFFRHNYCSSNDYFFLYQTKSTDIAFKNVKCSWAVLILQITVRHMFLENYFFKWQDCQGANWEQLRKMSLFWAQRVTEETSTVQSLGAIPSSHTRNRLWLSPWSQWTSAQAPAPGERCSKEHQVWVLWRPEECCDTSLPVSMGIARDLLSERELWSK